jgi:hypothetical protein
MYACLLRQKQQKKITMTREDWINLYLHDVEISQGQPPMLEAAIGYRHDSVLLLMYPSGRPTPSSNSRDFSSPKRLTNP